MPNNSNIFQHIGKILPTSVDNLVLQISFQFQVPNSPASRIEKCSFEKNALKFF